MGNNTNNIQRFFGKISSDLSIFIFAVLYLVLSLINYCFLFSGTSVPRYLSYPLILYGFIIIISAVLSKRIQYKSWQFILCLLFCISFIVSMLFSYKLGISENAKGLIWTGLQFILLGCIGGKSLKDRYLSKFINFVFIAAFVLSLVSLIFAFVGFMYYPSFVGTDSVDGGMSHGRLYGYFADPNYAGIFILIGIMTGFYKLISSKSKSHKVLVVAGLIFMLAFIGLCGSRTVIVALLIVVFVYFVFLFIYLIVFKKAHKNKLSASNKVIKYICCIGLSGIIAFSSFLVIVGIEFAYEAVEPQISKVICGTYTDPKHAFTVQVADGIRDINDMQNPYTAYTGVWDKLYANDAQDNQAISTNATEAASKYKDGEVDSEHVGILGRSEEQDITNKRSSLWKSAVELFCTSPIVGLSNRNFVEYANQNYPDTYIAQSGFHSLHNVFFDVLVSQGAIGIMLYMALFVLLLISIFKNIGHVFKLSKNSPNDNTLHKGILLYLTICSIILTCVIGSMFLTDLIYVNTPSTVIFWYCFGYASHKQSFTLKPV